MKRLALITLVLLGGCEVHYPQRQLLRACTNGGWLARTDGQLTFARFDRNWGWFEEPVAQDADLNSLCPQVKR